MSDVVGGRPVPRTPPFFVWVDTSTEFGLRSQPGLLLAWRRTPQSLLGIRKDSEWQCLVIHAGLPTPYSPESMWVYQSWMNPAHVRPAEAERPAGRTKKFRSR